MKKMDRNSTAVPLFMRAALLCLCMFLSACSSYWTEEVSLHDGVVINVRRSVSKQAKGDGGGSLGFHMSATIYSLYARNPNTKEKVSWQSEDEYVTPVLLEFDGSTAYLALLLPSIKNTNQKFGCPWPPYVFLRKVSGNSKWEKINKQEAPIFLRTANLSALYDRFFMERETPFDILKGDERERVKRLSKAERFGFQTKESIQRGNAIKEHTQLHYFQSSIPRTREEWSYKGGTPNCGLP